MSNTSAHFTSIDYEHDKTKLLSEQGTKDSTYRMSTTICLEPASAPTSSSAAGSNSELIVGNVSASLQNMPPHRIFNPETYCDLCNKEFCNKYFFMTHKANKHGVYTETSNAANSSSKTTFSTGVINTTTKSVNSGNVDTPFTLENNGDATTTEGDFACLLGNRSCQTVHLLGLHKSYFHPDPSHNYGGGGKQDSENYGTSVFSVTQEESNRSSRRRGEGACEGDLANSEDGGEVDEQGFHAEHDESEEIEASGDTTSDYDDLRRLQTMIMELNQTSSANIAGNPPPSRSYCTICHKELCNKYFMRIHMLKVHGISIESSTGLGGVPCDICNKELCSKYFLKVHRQNTHGVVD
ncbi:uncharacterized protein LOC110849781 isoform X2 [Folsomia candida]|uniref:Zinc finger protein hangover n=3 Tax=Folsomia candida TaxID=158441 RepID=A0A226EBG8_FOLCA|nr:uncharacterized protein LOC110849781 isoform X2 [Folsomia candida]OXA54915.1 Zinc finger protein hangover [Folsomia candida]